MAIDYAPVCENVYLLKYAVKYCFISRDISIKREILCLRSDESGLWLKGNVWFTYGHRTMVHDDTFTCYSTQISIALGNGSSIAQTSID